MKWRQQQGGGEGDKKGGAGLVKKMIYFSLLSSDFITNFDFLSSKRRFPSFGTQILQR